MLDHSITPLDDWDVDERTYKINQKFEQFFDVRHLERRPLGELYPTQISHVQRLLTRPPLADANVPVLFDGTSNIGAVDIAEAAGLTPIRVTFTAATRPRAKGASGVFRNPLWSRPSTRASTPANYASPKSY